MLNKMFTFHYQFNQNTGCGVKFVVNMNRQPKRLLNCCHNHRSEQPFYLPRVYPWAGLAGFCQKVEKTGFFHGKNRTGKNSFCRQKIGFCQNIFFYTFITIKYCCTAYIILASISVLNSTLIASTVPTFCSKPNRSESVLEHYYTLTATQLQIV